MVVTLMGEHVGMYDMVREPLINTNTSILLTTEYFVVFSNQNQQ